MVCGYKIVGTVLMLLALLDALGCVQGELSLKEMMEKDKELKRQLDLGISPTPGSNGATQASTNAAATAAAATDSAAAATAAAPSAGSDAATGAPSAAPAFAQHQELNSAAQPHQAPMMQSGGASSAGHSAALGTSALVGIGVGVGVACLVAVGAVVGALVHLRRRKRKGTQLEKQKTYGGTE